MTRSGSVLDEAVARASVTHAAVVDRGALAGLPQLLRGLGLKGAFQIVADSNTMAAAGDATLAVLRAAGLEAHEPLVLAERPRLKPRTETAREVAAALKQGGAFPLAVGSGVINDITKYAAELAGASYVSIATAASMDGYAASGGAMLDGGFKRTLACAPPLAVLADLDLIAKAPGRMAAWGYGDLAGKVVAGLDWILADALDEETIDKAAFSLVQDHIRDWLSQPARLAEGSEDALRRLIEGLLICGFAMQAYGNSRPASGSEHQISHCWEMEKLALAGEPVAHGACVGVGTVAMLGLYEWFLRQDIPARVKACRDRPPSDPVALEEEVKLAFPDPALAAAALAEVMAKQQGQGRRGQRLDALALKWTALQVRLQASIVPARVMKQWLAAAHAACDPAQLGVALDKLARDCRRARLIRRRYTLLDLLDELGWLDRAIGEVCTLETGLWDIPRRPALIG